ncbi:L-2-hydroxyglutarate dehydrogenase, mitochondrial-like [Artemia franciscana]|uniref:L-2-hydroxyglutarate dehydrogenase, mitochondrial n=1 Tax=Artemia franciscana TaxID=6661 RepID=A0AA88KRH6_ARTSF|nr:hypothetical protein QYM36_018473 [Artemia franciscana]
MLQQIIHKNVNRLGLTSVCRYFTSSADREKNYDIAIVGGGIVGVASARELLLRHPSLKLVVLEKEKSLAFHQSGHNSGVIHAGIYYQPGSLKAKLCVEGLHLSYKYLDEKDIPYKRCGKLVVATNKDEIGRLEQLHKRALQNCVPGIEMVDEKKIKEIEPFCKGLKALWSPNTGIVDWGLVTQYYGKEFQELGGEIYLGFGVDGFHLVPESQNSESIGNEYPVRITSKGKAVRAKHVLTCGGLQSDLLAELSGCPREPRIVPFRGEYLLLNPEKCHMIKGNIYPVPDPRVPFLGVHFTPRMDGSVWLGPNAVLAFKREGYGYGDINLRELFDALKYPGFQRMALKYALFGMGEMMRSIFISLQLKELRKYIPNIDAKDISRGPAGVRAQAIDPSGNMVDDFVFDMGVGEIGKRVLHVRNAPSPAATSSLSIAKMVANKVEAEFLV